MGVPFFKYIEAIAICDGKAATTNRTDITGSTCKGTLTVAFRDIGFIDFSEILLQDIPYRRRKLPACVSLSVWKNGNDYNMLRCQG